MKKVTLSRKLAPNSLSGLVLIGLFFSLGVAEVNAQDVGLTLNAGRGVITDKDIHVHNAHRLQLIIFSVVRAGSDNTYARRRIRMELVNPSGTVVDSITAGIGHDANQVVNGRAGSSKGDPYTLTAPAALGGSSVCSRWVVKLVDVETGGVPDPDPSSQKITATVEFNRVLGGSNTVAIT